MLVGWREGGKLKGRRHSLPEAQLNTTLEDSGGNDNGSWRASTGDVTVPIIQRLSSVVETTEPSAGEGTLLVGGGGGCGSQTATAEADRDCRGILP